jgi:hypothetical protein
MESMFLTLWQRNNTMIVSWCAFPLNFTAGWLLKNEYLARRKNHE